MTSEYLSSDFSYKKYSLEQLDNWVNDALNCEDLTPQDIYDTVIKCVDESVEYHKKYLTKSIELLSLLRGNRPVDYVDLNTDEKDWEDFWENSMSPWEHSDLEVLSKHYTEEQLNDMCDAAEKNEKERRREYNMREAEYYNKRAQLDLEETKKQLEIAKEYDEMTSKGYTMSVDGSWVKETGKGVASVSSKPDPYQEYIREAGGYEWTPGV